MKTRLVLCAVVAMYGLAACTPEQQMAVILDYAHRAAASEPAEPTITVVADCTTFVVHAEGWPDDSTISMAVESEPGWQLTPVGGVVDKVWEVWDGYGTYYWSVGGLLNLATEPTVVQSGTAECGPGQFD